MEYSHGAPLRVLLAGIEPVLSLAMESAISEGWHLVDDEYNIDRVLNTLRRQRYDVVVVYGYSRYLNAVELVRVLHGKGSQERAPACLVILPSLNKTDRYRFKSAGADHVMALEGENLVRSLVAGLETAIRARLATLELAQR